MINAPDRLLYFSVGTVILVTLFIVGGWLWNPVNRSPLERESPFASAIDEIPAQAEMTHSVLAPVVSEPFGSDASIGSRGSSVAAIIDLRVRDPQDKPLQDVFVYGQPEGASAGEWKRLGSSDELGYVRGPATGFPYRIRTIGTGYASEEFTIEDRPRETIAVRMNVAAEVRGHVFRKSSRKPVHGARVLAWEMGQPPSKDVMDASFTGSYPGAAMAICDPDGTFTIRGLKPHAHYEMAAAAAGWLSPATVQATAPDTNALVEVMPLYVSAHLLVSADGSLLRERQHPGQVHITSPSHELTPLDTESRLPIEQALPAAFRKRLASELILTRYFVAPPNSDCIGPVCFEARLFAAGLVRDSKHYVYRTIQSIPVGPFVIPAVKGFGSIRIRFDDEFVRSHRLGDPQLTGLGYLRLNRGINYGETDQIDIPGLDDNNEFLLEDVPAGYYSLGFVGPTQDQEVLTQSREGKTCFWVESGKSVEVHFAPTNFGRIAIIMDDRGGEWEFRVHASVAKTRTCCNLHEPRTFRFAGPLPALPEGSYHIEVHWRSDSGRSFRKLGEGDVTILPNVTLQVPVSQIVSQKPQTGPYRKRD